MEKCETYFHRGSLPILSSKLQLMYFYFFVSTELHSMMQLGFTGCKNPEANGKVIIALTKRN